MAAITPVAMAARAKVEGSGTVWKAKYAGAPVPVLHEVRKVPVELNLLMVLLLLFAA